jgi:GT2 family glycosyltransferase
MKIRVLMITYNRVDYTQLSLRTLLDTLPENAKVTIWDNNSSDDMRALLRNYEKHAAVEQIIFNRTNDKLRGPTNWFWQNAGDADFVSKVDDDCLMPAGWCETLTALHSDLPEAGVIGCWRFLDEDFVPEIAKRKIQSFGSHQIMRNCWVEGSGYLMKRAVIDKVGFLLEDESFTGYCTRAAAAGFVNGWYYPFLYQEHMDDPRVPNTGIVSEEAFKQLRPLSASTFRIETREDWIKRLKYSAWSLQACSFNPRDYLGWHASFRRRLHRWLGRQHLPRA